MVRYLKDCFEVLATHQDRGLQPLFIFVLTSYFGLYVNNKTSGCRKLVVQAVSQDIPHNSITCGAKLGQFYGEVSK